MTKELPLLNIHVDKIEEYKSILKESEIVDKSHEGVNNADLEEIDRWNSQNIHLKGNMKTNYIDYY